MNELRIIRPRSSPIVAVTAGLLGLVYACSVQASAQEPPRVWAVDIKHAAVATTKELNISQLAGMSDERIQQEYQWCRGMADLCLSRSLPVSKSCNAA